MNLILKKCPVPIVGLMLGLAQVGNLVQSYGEVYRSTFGILSAILLIVIIFKFIKYPKDVAEISNNPAVASVLPTFSMGLMVLSTYLKLYGASLAFSMWIMGFMLHITLIIWFTRKFVLNFKIEQVFPSWFIVYVGIVTASVTASTFDMQNLGKIVFWLGFINYLILLPIVIYRVVNVKKMPEQTLPTLTILAAPASLLLAGYMNSFGTKNMSIVWFLMALSIIMYIVAMIILINLLKLRFYPSYSAFTFPLIISGVAIKLTNGFLIKSGQAILPLQYLVKFQEAVAIVITLYVLVRYIKFLLITDSISVDITQAVK